MLKRNSVLLAIDIGNTTVSFSILKGQRVVQINTVETGKVQAKFRAELKILLNRIRRKFPNVRDAVICSVVPKVSTHRQRRPQCVHAASCTWVSSGKM